jgi:cysteine desulfurase/selenocysteine lyase
VQQFLNARSAKEIVFCARHYRSHQPGCEELGRTVLICGDEIIVSHLEHHANIVPWQQLANRKGLKLRVIPVNDAGELLMDEYAKLLNPKTKLVSFAQVSNAVGTVTPAKQIIEMAKGSRRKSIVGRCTIGIAYARRRTTVGLRLVCFSGHKYSDRRASVWFMEKRNC